MNEAEGWKSGLCYFVEHNPYTSPGQHTTTILYEREINVHLVSATVILGFCYLQLNLN